jgi:hypothetical protein
MFWSFVPFFSFQVVHADEWTRFSHMLSKHASALPLSYTTARSLSSFSRILLFSTHRFGIYFINLYLSVCLFVLVTLNTTRNSIRKDFRKGIAVCIFIWNMQEYVLPHPHCCPQTCTGCLFVILSFPSPFTSRSCWAKPAVLPAIWSPANATCRRSAHKSQSRGEIATCCGPMPNLVTIELFT